MNARELAAKFTAKIAVAAVEKDRQNEVAAASNVDKRTADIEHCKNAMLSQNVSPFSEELKHDLGERQFSSPRRSTSSRITGLSACPCKIGDGASNQASTAATLETSL